MGKSGFDTLAYDESTKGWTSFYSYKNPNDNYTINLDSTENFYLRDTSTNVAAGDEFIWGGSFDDTTGLPNTASEYPISSGDNTIDLTSNLAWRASITGSQFTFYEGSNFANLNNNPKTGTGNENFSIFSIRASC